MSIFINDLTVRLKDVKVHDIQLLPALATPPDDSEPLQSKLGH